MKSSSKRISALIMCAGKGLRSGLLYNKIFYMFGQKTVLEMTLDNFCESFDCDITLVISPCDEQRIREIVKDKYDVKICFGGNTRTESVRNGLNSIEKCDIVVIHDGARPYAPSDLINRCIESAILYGSGIAAVKSTDTLKKVQNKEILEDIDRETIYRMQTPQAFEYEKILAAYSSVTCSATDDSEIFLSAGYTPRIVEGSYDNIKITGANDLYKVNGENIFIGNGFDVHMTRQGRKLILGGVEITHDKGLLGHSDADVLVHAIMDALLSAAGLPDIGVLFPNTSNEFKDADSIFLLKKVKAMLDENGFFIGNISSVIIAEQPKLSPHIPKMRDNIAEALCINTAMINISATTAETLGLIGENKGIAASAVCLLKK